MRIRKGKRCLPLAPTNWSFVHEAVALKRGGGIDDEMECGTNQALLRLVALAIVLGADIINGHP